MKNLNSIENGFTLIELMIVIAIISVLASIAVSQYQGFVLKSQTTRLIAELSELKLTVEICLNNGKTILGVGRQQCDPRATPSNLIQGGSQVGVVLSNNTGVAQISSPLTTTANIQATVANNVSSALRGKKIILQRTDSGDWGCKSNIETKYLPSSCTYDASVQ